jgi:hypothetical protein
MNPNSGQNTTGLKVFPLSLDVPLEMIWEPEAQVQCLFCPFIGHPYELSKHLLKCKDVSIGCPLGTPGSCEVRIPIFKAAAAAAGAERIQMSTFEIEAAIKTHSTSAACTAIVKCVHPRCGDKFCAAKFTEHQAEHKADQAEKDKLLMHVAPIFKFKNTKPFVKEIKALTAQAAQLLGKMKSYDDEDQDARALDVDLGNWLRRFGQSHNLSMSLLPPKILPEGAYPAPVDDFDDDDDIMNDNIMVALQHNAGLPLVPAPLAHPAAVAPAPAHAH